MIKLNKLITITLFFLLALLSGCTTQPQIKDDTITIYFARHGKTLFNSFDVVQGWSDSPLTDQGIEIAQYLGEGLKDINFDAYYTSDAGRQRETMQIIFKQMGIKNDHHIELQGLREVFFGGYEGGSNIKMAMDSMSLIGYKSVKNYFNDYKAGKLPIQQIVDAIANADTQKLAENYEQVSDRIQNSLTTIIQNALNNNQKNVLVISSGMSMQVMIANLTDNIDRNKPLSNAAVIKITYKNGEYHVDEIGNMTYVNRGKLSLTKK